MKMDAIDPPVTFTTTTATITRSDLNWHFIYCCQRGIWKRVLWMSFFAIATIIAVDTYQPGRLDSQLSAVFLTLATALGLLASYVIDYIVMTFSQKKIIKRFPNQTTEYLFDREKMFMKSEYGESMQKYDVFRRIYLYKHLIVFAHTTGLFYIVPWRDVPVEQRDLLREMLTVAKARLKI